MKKTQSQPSGTPRVAHWQLHSLPPERLGFNTSPHPRYPSQIQSISTQTPRLGAEATDVGAPLEDSEKSSFPKNPTHDSNNHNPTQGNKTMMSGTRKAVMADLSIHSEPSYYQHSVDPDTSCTDPQNSSPTQPLTPIARLPTPSPRLSLSRHTPPPNRTFRPTYHIARPHRKLVDWSFRPRKNL
ncbi:hypothetical protein ABVT39_015642 [Epinephelus coioides]